MKATDRNTALLSRMERVKRKIEFELLEEILKKIPVEAYDQIRVRVIVEIHKPLFGLKMALKGRAENLSVNFNAEITYRSEVTPYIGIKATASRIIDIAEQIWVKKIWHVPEVELDVEDIVDIANYATSNISLIDTAAYLGVDTARSLGYDGTGVIIGVVDTGVKSTHPMFAGKILKQKNFSEGPDTEDRHGHGTWCSSCALGVYWDGCPTPGVGPLEGMAPGAMLLSAKSFETGSASMDQTMAGMEWAAQEGAHIISCSWGGTADFEPQHELIKQLIAVHGTIFVFAAGNSGPFNYSIKYPAGYPECIAVGSVAVFAPAPDTVAVFSSRGPTKEGLIKPDVCAPGGNRDEGDEMIYAAGIKEEGWGLARGTSMAAPHFAGSLGNVLQSGRGVEDIFRTCRNIYAPAKDVDSGWGVPEIGISVQIDPPTTYTVELTSNAGINFKIVGIDNSRYYSGSTPWTNIILEGWYRIDVGQLVEIGGQYYAFRGWEDGSPYASRYIHLFGNTFMEATYEAVAEAYVLTIQTDPSAGIPFKINGVEKASPLSILLEAGAQLIEMPQMFMTPERIKVFDIWSDGSKELVHSINLVANLTISANYLSIFGQPILYSCKFYPLKDEIRGIIAHCHDNGIAQSIFIYLELDAPGLVKCALYKPVTMPVGPFNLIAETEEKYISSEGWHEFILIAPVPLEADQDYAMEAWSDSAIKSANICGGSGEIMALLKSPAPYGSWPNPLDPTGIGPGIEYVMYVKYSTEAAITHVIAVNSVPVEGVSVTVDGILAGVTPLQVTLEKGTHLIAVPEVITE